MTWEDLVHRIVKQPSLNARLLNTLSYLEYVGTRKILKSQDAGELSSDMLEHIAEEARHAQRMRRLAEKVAGQRFAGYSEATTLAFTEARRYVQALDAAVNSKLAANAPNTQAYLNYLHTTLLLEVRAEQAYPPYAMALEPLGLATVLRQIVREEEGHLEHVRERIDALDPAGEARCDLLVEHENRAWEKLVSTWARATVADCEYRLSS